jgi:hypothetical protein
MSGGADSGLLQSLHAEVLRELGDEAQTLRIERAVLGIFFTGVKLSNGTGGLCATPVKSVPQAVCCPSSAAAMPVPGKIAGRKATDVLQDLYRSQDLRRALAESVWQRKGGFGLPLSTGDSFEMLDIRPQDYVALVGAFPPYLRELRRRGQRFSVLELDPATLKPHELPYFVPAERAPQVLPEADVFVTTGTILLNGTLDGLLALLKPGTQAAVIGPTATLLPEPYAACGVTVLGGTRVREADRLLDLLAEGGSGYHLFAQAVERVGLRLDG